MDFKPHAAFLFIILSIFSLSIGCSSDLDKIEDLYQENDSYAIIHLCSERLKTLNNGSAQDSSDVSEIFQKVMELNKNDRQDIISNYLASIICDNQYETIARGIIRYNIRNHVVRNEYECYINYLIESLENSGLAYLPKDVQFFNSILPVDTTSSFPITQYAEILFSDFKENSAFGKYALNKSYELLIKDKEILVERLLDIATSCSNEPSDIFKEVSDCLDRYQLYKSDKFKVSPKMPSLRKKLNYYDSLITPLEYVQLERNKLLKKIENQEDKLDEYNIQILEGVIIGLSFSAGDKSVFEIRTFDKIMHSYLSVTNLVYSPSGYFKKKVIKSGTMPVKLKPQFGNVVQDWDVYREITDEDVDSYNADVDVLHEFEKELDSFPPPSDEYNRLKKKIQYYTDLITQTKSLHQKDVAKMISDQYEELKKILKQEQL